MNEQTSAAETPRDVARSLTLAQTFVMCSMRQDAGRHAPYCLYRPRPNSLASCLALAKRGIIARDEVGNVEAFERQRVGYAVLTPLGVEVIAELVGVTQKGTGDAHD